MDQEELRRLYELLWVPKPMVVVPASPTLMFNKHAFSMVWPPIVTRADIIYGIGYRTRLT